MNFEMVKRNFERGLWSAAMVKMAVRKGVITKAQYQEITGRKYCAGKSNESAKTGLQRFYFAAAPLVCLREKEEL